MAAQELTSSYISRVEASDPIVIHAGRFIRRGEKIVIDDDLNVTHVELADSQSWKPTEIDDAGGYMLEIYTQRRSLELSLSSGGLALAGMEIDDPIQARRETVDIAQRELPTIQVTSV